MRTTLVHFLCALGVLACVCGSAKAVPVIELAPFHDDAVDIQQAPTDLNDLSPFGLNTNPAGNFGPAAFHNNTGMLFTDFHFSFPAQPQRAGGDGGSFFGGVAGTFTTLDFTLDGGTGIPNSTNFTIEARSFNGVTRIEATPTVPEPSTLLLCGTIAGLALVARWRRRRHADRAWSTQRSDTPSSGAPSSDHRDSPLQALVAFCAEHQRCGEQRAERHGDRLDLRCACGAVLIQALARLVDTPGDGNGRQARIGSVKREQDRASGRGGATGS